MESKIKLQIISILNKKLNYDITKLILNNIYKQINNENIREAVNLWIINKNECLKIYAHISYWNTSKVTNMEGLFENYNNFNDNINDWNTSNVTNMSYMFYYAEEFNQCLNNWNTSNVSDMMCMFYYAEEFNRCLNNWNTSNVT